MLSLSGLGIAAAATIVAFFGIGLSLLIKPPAGLIRSAPTAAAVGDRASSTTPPAATARREPPALRDGPLPPPHNEASAPPTLAGQPPAGVPVPSAAPSRTASATPAPPTPSSVPDRGATPMPAVHDAAAPPAPAAPTQPPRVETSPASAAAMPRPGATPPAPPVAPAKTPAAASEPATSSPPSTAEIVTLLIRGDATFRAGDLNSARLFYLRAFAAGEGRGALGIGASYDPFFLRRFHLWTQHGDPAEAEAWYRRARDLGASEAQSRLARLTGKPPG